VDPLKHFFPSDQIFSGFNSEYHKNLLDEIYVLVKYGHFSYSDIYSMPTYQRRYFIDKMVEENDKKNEK
jgi:hypothetical protein